MGWNPEQYLKFAAPRLRPALDLLARVDLAAPARVVDLGCGAGNVTQLLQQRWPGAQLTGVDDSPQMLEAARQRLPGARWLQQGIAEWRPETPVDLVYSNAALHWLPDHATLFPRLAGSVAPGGVLAVQMPRNFGAPSHALIEATVHDGPWAERLRPLLAPPPVAAPAEYFGWLEGHVRELDLWETEYLQVLEGADPVKEWVKGTWLKRFLDALPPGEARDFEAACAQRLRAAYPVRADGRTLFPFRRLFIVALR